MNDNYAKEIDLLEIWYLFLDKLKFIILFLILGALIAGGITYFLITPKYEATSQLYMVSATNEQVNLTDIQIGTNLTADYSALILSRPMLESCIKELNLDATTEGLRKMIDISNPSGTRVIEITTLTTNPQLSKDIANKMAQLTVNNLPDILESNTPHIVEEAILPLKPASPSLVKNVAIGGFGLAVFYFAICIVKFLLNDVIYSSEEFEKYFGITPLTAIGKNKSKIGGASRKQ